MLHQTKKGHYFYGLFFVLVSLTFMLLINVSSLHISLFLLGFFWIFSLEMEEVKERAIAPKNRFSFLSFISRIDNFLLKKVREKGQVFSIFIRSLGPLLFWLILFLVSRDIHPISILLGFFLYFFYRYLIQLVKKRS